MSWHCKASGAYAETSNDAYENAVMIQSYLSAKGWSFNAICAVIGNIGHEGGYNPWRWESDVVLPKGSSLIYSKKHGYGLMQFTPASGYINNASGFSGYGPNYTDQTGSQTDGNAQLELMDSNILGGYIPKSPYNLSFSEFKKSTADVQWLAAAWLYNFERPADPSSSIAARRESALYWYNKLDGDKPTPSTTKYVNILIEGNGNAYAVPSYGESGTEITLTATPTSGGSFEGWSVISGGVTIVDNKFTLGESDVYIKATFSGGKPVPTHKIPAWLLWQFTKNNQRWASTALTIMG